MWKNWKWMLLAPLMAVFSSDLVAQSAEMADTMRSEGKIYVVVGVIVLIFAVLFAYLIRLDVLLRKTEQKGKESAQ